MKLSPLQRRRRDELQRAAYEVARRRGFHAITIDHIAAQAGKSRGIVHHYFGSKRRLVESAVRHAHGVYRTSVTKRLKNAGTPSERLWCIVEATFDAEQFSPDICRLWLTIFDELKHDEKLAHLVAILDKRSISLTLSTIRHLVDADRADRVAFQLMALMDGFWLLSASDKEITRELALRHMAEFIRRNIPRYDLGAATSLG
jgi:TetR/AcrR family transcriptional regulator, transcriptional repressor of bet genes